MKNEEQQKKLFPIAEQMYQIIIDVQQEDLTESEAIQRMTTLFEQQDLSTSDYAVLHFEMLIAFQITVFWRDTFHDLLTEFTAVDVDIKTPDLLPSPQQTSEIFQDLKTRVLEKSPIFKPEEHDQAQA